jgi:hypothetical protein
LGYGLGVVLLRGWKMSDWLKFTAQSTCFMIAGATIPFVIQGDAVAFFVAMAFLLAGSTVDSTRNIKLEAPR